MEKGRDGLLAKGKAVLRHRIPRMPRKKDGKSGHFEDPREQACYWLQQARAAKQSGDYETAWSHYVVALDRFMKLANPEDDPLFEEIVSIFDETEVAEEILRKGIYR